jgi:hypothetical protein
MAIDDPKGKPVLFDKIGVELPGKLVKLVADDMERARLEREERDKKKKGRRPASGEGEGEGEGEG